MDTKAHLEKQFAAAGIPIKVFDRSFIRNLRGGAQVTQIDVDTRGGERIRCFPSEGSEITVMSVDKAHQQVVLSVTEPERTFTERQNLFEPDPETGKYYKWVERVTPSEERRLLVGMDERHLFISQMRSDHKPSSVKQAHERLAPAGVPGSEKRRKKAKIIRQGEWFFVPATPEEKEQIAAIVKLRGIESNTALGSDGSGRRSGGKPHTAKERVRVGGSTENETRTLRGRTRVFRSTRFGWVEFVRGTIKHADHKTVKLQDWHKVLSNTENRSAGTVWFD